ncbi:MAG TPA: hypothetical protein VK395_25880 [Gemmataceae bacterium]|nr:hypothetical protein [Gemmataceae bacterium]
MRAIANILIGNIPLVAVTTVRQLMLRAVKDTFPIRTLDGGGSILSWDTAGSFFSLARAADKLSVVCRQNARPVGTACAPAPRWLGTAGTISVHGLWRPRHGDGFT